MGEATPSSIQKLSIIVPCYNEEGNIPRFSAELMSYFQDFPFEKEYIYVDDGSTDQTHPMLMDLKSKNNSVYILHYDENRGLGAALRSGIKLAEGDAILTLDGDLTFHPKESPKLFNSYGNGVDCVTGSAVLGAFENVHPFRRFLSRTVNQIYSILLGQKIFSMSSIFRLYRSSSIKDLVLTSDSFDINAEILFKILAKKGCVVEVPVTLLKRQAGESKLNFGREVRNHLKMFFDLISWRFRSI